MKSYITIDAAQCRRHIKYAGLTIRGAADAIGINLHTLHNQIQHGRMPKEVADKLLALPAARNLPATVPPIPKDAEPSTPKAKQLRTGNQGAQLARIALSVPLDKLPGLLAAISFMGGKVLGIEA